MTNDGVNIPLLRKAVEFAEAAAARQLTFAESRPLDESYHDERDELDPSSDPSDLTWNQAFWAGTKVPFVATPEEATLEHCGTAYCIAGFVNSQHPGYEVRAEAVENVFADDENGSDAYRVNLVETIYGHSFQHSETARAALGISKYDADQLFNGGNTIDEVRYHAERIAGEKL